MEKAQLKTVQEAQKADPVLTTYIKLSKAELTCKGMQVSPQGILYKVMDGKQLIMVPHELRQKILVENHDVPTAGRVESTERWTSSNGITGGVVSGVMWWPTCGHVRFVNA